MSKPEEVAKRILGKCSCHVSYTQRNMIDPGCAWHEYAEDIIEALTEARNQGRNEALSEVIDLHVSDFVEIIGRLKHPTEKIGEKK